MGENVVIVGLGNPGEEYANTRHNIGFMVLDELARRWSAPSFNKKFRGLFSDVQVANRKVLLLKPQTYMNLSGRSVGEIIQFYKIDPESDLIVVSDDLDLPTGKLRIRKGGSAGGHNGLKDIVQCIGTKDFPRIRVGIGRSKGVSGHVLGKIKGAEKEALDDAVQRAADAIVTWLDSGVDKAMNEFNRSPDES
jgi:PTH1 family peptidyl-tRNA hydrolase